MKKVINLEINETYDFNCNNIENNNLQIQVENGVVKANELGTYTIKVNNEEVVINVSSKGSLSSTFDISYGRFSNKNLLILGDSVSAQATIGENNKTYSTLLKEKLNINKLLNAAIGGTTLTYMYEGSNIDKEYHSHETAIDCCRVVDRLNNNKQLSDIDYVFIAYGHNDQYFKPEIDENNGKYDNLEDLHSFKNSFRFIVKKLKEANPNIRIIVLNCTYSEYDINSKSPYGNKYGYENYRNANKEMADELSLKHIDPWEYMKQFFDHGNGNKYYQDSVHISPLGHNELFKYLLNK